MTVKKEAVTASIRVNKWMQGMADLPDRAPKPQVFERAATRPPGHHGVGGASEAFTRWLLRFQTNPGMALSWGSNPIGSMRVRWTDQGQLIGHCASLPACCGAPYEYISQ